MNSTKVTAYVYWCASRLDDRFDTLADFRHRIESPKELQKANP